MVNLQIPAFTFDEVYDTCINGSRKYADYVTAKPILSKANIQYRDYFQVKKGYKIPKQKDATVSIKYADLIKLYKNKFCAKTHLARKYYDAIRNSSNHCPFCGVNSVKTLEHFLPKKHFAFYTISPLNLLPCCWECNLGHGSNINMADETTLHLHPYFDTIDNSIWLKAKIVIVNNEPNFVFEVDDDCGLDAPLISRLKKHHSLFNLDSLFSKNAGAEFNGLCHYLINSFHGGGIEDVIQSLQDHLDSYKMTKWNFWKPAFFRALMNCKWITSGEFIVYNYK